MIENSLSEICKAFGIKTEVGSLGNGHINDTYIATKDGYHCVLQKINTDVFKNPEEVMNNIFEVTSHLRSKLEAEGSDANRGTLNFLMTVDGKKFFKDVDGDCYRVYRFVEDSKTYDCVTHPSLFYEAARTFGKFQKLLSDFPAENLYKTIDKFHDTPNRVLQLKKSINTDKFDRIKECEAEIEYAISQIDDVGIVCDALNNKTIPFRVTHNDTKLNNVLFDEKTKKGICVIDLDTVMPGSLLYDFGDALRFGANSAAEDESDLDKVQFDLNLFEAFVKGFASELNGTITPVEKELMPFSAKLMTYECGIRFLSDFLNGDTYFKTKYNNHNLVRARNQFKLCREIDMKYKEMDKIVDESF